jgi:hypothetical protein
MKRKYFFGLFCGLLLILAGAGNLFAASSNEKAIKPIICTINTYYECDAVKGCVARSAAELDAPRFFRIWIDKKEIELLGAPGRKNRVSRIKKATLLNDVLILQGIEPSGKHGAVGWTISINSQTGGLTFTASGDEVAYTGIGACTVEE